uniref:hypothetical protein n=1 Tax=Algoriphagus sp. TaxID=1872435 RepID=UPI004048EA88
MLKFLTKKIDLRKVNLSFNINPSFSKGFFVQLFFFFSLMPYVSPVPLGSDVQIVTGLIGYFILLALLLKDKFVLNKREILIVGLALLFIAYINIEEPTYQFRKAIGPMYGFSIYYIAKHYKQYFSLRVMSWVIIIYLIGAITQYISPGLFNLTFENFIRVAKYSETTGRGVTSLSPEPSFLGILCIYLLVIQDWFYTEKSRDKKYYYRLFACVFMILISKSGGGYILLFLFFASKSILYLKRYWYLIGVFSLTFVIFIANIEEVSGNKGLADLVKVLKSTSPKELLGISSLSNRVNPVLVGLYGAFEQPLGRGSGSFTTQARDVYLNNGLDQMYPVYNRDRLLYEISMDSVSTFGKYIFEYGVFFVLYLFLVIVGVNFKKMGVFITFLVLTGLLFSLPIVYPPIWLVFGFYSRKGSN